MRLTLKYGLPFITATLTYRRKEVEVSHVLVDTGSARTTFAADVVAQIGLIPEPEDALLTVRGVGGAEVVFRHDDLQPVSVRWRNCETSRTGS
jgi:hypothetical protein